MIPFLIPFHHFDLQLLRKRRLPCPRRRQHFIRLLVRDLECFYMFTYFIVHASDKEFRSYCSSSYIIFCALSPISSDYGAQQSPVGPADPFADKDALCKAQRVSHQELPAKSNSDRRPRSDFVDHNSKRSSQGRSVWMAYQ